MQSVEKIHELCQQSSGKDLKIQVAALVALHHELKDYNDYTADDEVEVYEKFLSKMDRIDGTSVHKYFPRCIDHALNHIQTNTHPDTQGKKLSELNFIIGAFTDQMDEDGSFEESCEFLSDEAEFQNWYELACTLGGYRGDDDNEESNMDEEQQSIYDQLVELSGIEFYQALHDILAAEGIPMADKKQIQTAKFKNYSSYNVTAYLQQLVPTRTFETFTDPFGSYTEEEFLNTYPDIWKAAAKATENELMLEVVNIDVINDDDCDNEIETIFNLNGEEISFQYETNGYLDMSVFQDIYEYADEQLSMNFFFDATSADECVTGVYLPTKLIPVFSALISED